MSAHESDAALSRRVAEKVGWTHFSYTGALDEWQGVRPDGLRCVVRPFATSLDAIAALEREAGLQCFVWWQLWNGILTCNADIRLAPHLAILATASDSDPDHAEPRARCLAYLATKEHTT